MKKSLLLLTTLFLFSGCGGGGGGYAPTSSSATPTPKPVTPESLANICTSGGEKSWVRAHLNDVYLWYDEIVDVVPTSYSTTDQYFDALLVKSKDRFSFTSPQVEIDQYFRSGTSVGYGATYVTVGDRLRVSYTQPGSPAALQNLTRGVEIIAINGVLRSQMHLDARIAALYPTTVGTVNQFTVKDVGATTTRVITLSAVNIVKAPILSPTIITTSDNKKVGYFAFTDHIVSAENLLIATLTDFKQNGIDDLVLDVRYNGGGLLYIADEVASMIAGTAAENRIFEQATFNRKHPEKTSDPFYTLRFFPVNIGSLVFPQLNLPRVFVLTGPGTCSASESIINGLSPFVQVITIGGTTCGKPYGMIQKNNCGTAYFAIEFSGVNDGGFGDYANGIAPTCAASDDLEHALGDANETLLAAALAYRTAGSCPVVSASNPHANKLESQSVREVYRAPWRENRVINHASNRVGR